MTDTTSVLATDPDDFMQRWADYEKSAAVAHSSNKTSLFAALRATGITVVTVVFDGSGDSGQIESVEARSDDTEVDLLPTIVEIVLLEFRADEPERVSQRLEEAIETLAYALLAQSYRGWENNGGAFGEFEFDVAAETITLDFNQRIETSENFITSY